VPGLLELEGTDVKRTTIWTLRAATQHTEHATTDKRSDDGEA
jgi:hypothetical protein